MQVLAGVMPIDIKAREREEIHRMGLTGIGTRRDISERMLNEWQARWDNAQTGRSTHVLMPDVRERDCDCVLM